jgi:hypothetical protein
MLDLLKLIFRLIADLFRSRARLEAEVLALRQQINVLQRLRPERPTLSSTDRLLLGWVCRLFPNARGALTIVSAGDGPALASCQIAFNPDPLSLPRMTLHRCGVTEPRPASRSPTSRSRAGLGGPRVASLRLCAVLEAPAVVAGLDDVAVVRQPIEHSGCHLGVAEHLWPIGEGEIGGDQQRRVLVELAD